MFEDKKFFFKIGEEIQKHARTYHSSEVVNVFEAAWWCAAMLTTNMMKEADFWKITGTKFTRAIDFQRALNRLNNKFVRYNKSMSDMMLFVAGPKERSKADFLHIYLAHINPITQEQLDFMRTELNATVESIDANLGMLKWLTCETTGKMSEAVSSR